MSLTFAANIVIGLVVLLHLYFLLLEMFLWDTPYGRKKFGLTPELSSATKKLASNQGLYNGFLAAGLIWGLILGVEGYGIKGFFLSCVIVAGVYGAFTINPRVFFIQAAPALAALLLLVCGARGIIY